MRNLAVVVFVLLSFSSFAWAQPECDRQCRQPGKVIKVVLPVGEAWQVVYAHGYIEVRVYPSKDKTNFFFKSFKLGDEVVVREKTSSSCCVFAGFKTADGQGELFSEWSVADVVVYFRVHAEWPSEDYEIIWEKGKDTAEIRLIGWMKGEGLLYPDKTWHFSGSRLPPEPFWWEIKDDGKEDRKCDCKRWQAMLRGKYFALKGSSYDVLPPMLADGFYFVFVDEEGKLLRSR